MHPRLVSYAPKSCILFILLSSISLIQTHQIKLIVWPEKTISTLFPFWESTGLWYISTLITVLLTPFSPPDPHSTAEKFLLGPDMQQNLALIGALPSNDFRQVRIHWLLDLIKLRPNSSQPEFDFNYLDQLILILRQNRLKPGFEIMGNPGNVFTDFEDRSQLIQWKELVKQLVQRYVQLLGNAYVSKWNFESWNEPDHKRLLGFNFTLQGFLNYYDACSQGLKEAGGKLFRLGGPGERCLPFNKTSHCWTLLEHVYKGKNVFTSKKSDTKLDFISVHEKGEDEVLSILTKERLFMEKLCQKYPKFCMKHFVNNEADPSKGWSTPKVVNTDASYAAMMVKNILLHIEEYFNGSSKPQFKLLSNDNAFLSYYPHQFHQRTLLARFQINNTHPPHTIFIQKPVYAATGMLTFLGDQIIRSKLVNDKSKIFDAIATKQNTNTSFVWTVLMSVIGSSNQSKALEIQVNLNGSKITKKELRWACFLVDNQHSNPFEIWRSRKSPAYPSDNLLKALHRAQGPKFLHEPKPLIWDVGDHVVFGTKVTSKPPAVFMMLICSQNEAFDEKVSVERIVNISQPQIYLQVKSLQYHQVSKTVLLLFWEPLKTKCLHTYEIEHSKVAEQKHFLRLNQEPVLFGSYYVFLSNVSGFYRVRGIDYWERKSNYSNVILVT